MLGSGSFSRSSAKGMDARENRLIASVKALPIPRATVEATSQWNIVRPAIAVARLVISLSMSSVAPSLHPALQRTAQSVITAPYA